MIDGAHEADPDDGNSDVDSGVTERVGNTGPASLSAEQAFQQYVLPEIDVLGRVALSLTRHSADAEDLVQDTLVRAWKAIGRFDGRYPRAWLLTIMRNTNLNRVRKRLPELERNPDEGVSVLETAEPHASAEDEVVDPVFDANVVSALNGLTDDFRQVVELVDVDGLTYAEAAEIMDVPVGTVMSRLHRARRRIRDELVVTRETEGQ
ncbi:MAG: ECF RNA polymerase sigma factor SigR [Acidimicrobiaceae bacterium]|nr:ECF RNA polymerase sigma factor SigR [Acidimicrobiaceae bacterium]